MAHNTKYIQSRKHTAGARQPASTASLAAAAALVALGLPAHAQQSDTATPVATGTTLKEVKVESARDTGYQPSAPSSPKFTQPLLDTPQTVTVIRKEVLQEQAATTLTDALRNTPGITFQLGENGNTATGDAVFLRGFDTQGSIFVDGVRDVGTIARDMFNIEQVEVIKGPAGADIGRGAPTGYINLSSKQPVLGDVSSASLSAGTDDQKRIAADINRALGETSAVRLNLMAQNSGTPGRDFVRNQRWGFAPSVAFGLGTDTRTTLQYLHMDQSNRPDGGLPTVGLAGYTLPQLAARGGNGPRADTSRYYGYLSDHDDVKADQLTAKFERDLAPGVTLRNLTRWGRSTQDLVLTAPFSNGLITPNLNDPASWSMRVLPQGKHQRNTVLANQTNITADLNAGGFKHSVTAGLELAREEQVTRARAALIDASNGVRVVTNGVPSFQSYVNLYDPNPGRAFAPVRESGARTEGKVTTAALYAFDTIEFSPQWQLSAGLRYEHYKTDYLSLPATGATTAVARTDGSDSLLTGKLGLVFKPADNGSIYAAYATSAKPPGSDFALSTTAANINNPNVNPQKARTLELGTKWEVLNRSLTLTAAAFRTENRNEQTTPDPVTNEVVQFGKTRVQGIELSAAGQITPVWQVIGGLARTDAKILEGTAAQNGAAIRYSPKLTATLWTTYKLPMGLTVGGGARYVDTQMRSTSNAAITAASFFPNIPSYTVFDAMLGYEVNRNVSLQLNVFNLADKFYLARVNNAGNRYMLGAARSALLTANVKF
ncbi:MULTISPECIES: catecholate siderophore receptor Fiu [unclassified Acidovorax]|uniref:catecholate siderophore receptor Fiu n=1 Tax=unclassified Acidovorax TaxID=2684926 RepID=UPI00288356FC|nr:MULTISPECIES: catecholate siderophore receptor Fiu [unclassified Acidovorax]